MDSYDNPIQEEVMQATVRTSIMQNGQFIRFDTEGLRAYETEKLHADLLQQAEQIRRQYRESQLIRLIALSQFLLFLLCGFSYYGQLRNTGGYQTTGKDNIQYQR